MVKRCIFTNEVGNKEYLLDFIKECSRGETLVPVFQKDSGKLVALYTGEEPTKLNKDKVLDLLEVLNSLESQDIIETKGKMLVPSTTHLGSDQPFGVVIPYPEGQYRFMLPNGMMFWKERLYPDYAPCVSRKFIELPKVERFESSLDSYVNKDNGAIYVDIEGQLYYVNIEGSRDVRNQLLRNHEIVVSMHHRNVLDNYIMELKDIEEDITYDTPDFLSNLGKSRISEQSIRELNQKLTETLDSKYRIVDNSE